MELEQLFCDVNDFYLMFEPSFQAQLLFSSERKRIKHSQLCLSEIMTIIIYFHHSNYRNFKHYY
ncbi:mobile element protein [Geminocystis sp. NIES-3708]|nr:mobile element protein [Geminocystis sp. NIES-3708]